MLEKNKDYIEMRVSSTDFAFVQNEPVHLCVEGLVDATNGCFPGPGEDYILISKEKFEALQTENEQLKKKLEELHNQLIWTGDELGRANSSNNSWKAAAECNSPKELIEKIYGLEEKVKVLETEAEVYSRTLRDWKEGTGCPSPSAVKTLIESGASWHHAYNESKEVNKKFADSIKAWQNVTGYSTPEDYLAAMIKNTTQSLYSWQKATGCSTAEEAKETIQKWKDLTKCETPEAAATWITLYESACKRGNNLAIRVAKWKEVTGCSTPEEAKNWVAEIGEANGNLAQAVLSWREITGFSTPEKCSSYIDTLEKKLEDIKDLIEED